MNNDENKAKLSFACSCNGCRNYPTRPAQIWHHDQIASKAQGFYFSKDTMRFFNSKIADFKRSCARDESLMVIVSSKRDENAREYEIVTLCPYGNLMREWSRLKHYPSLKAARNSARWNCTIEPQICDCHGCQLDKAGR